MEGLLIIIAGALIHIAFMMHEKAFDESGAKGDKLFWFTFVLGLFGSIAAAKLLYDFIIWTDIHNLSISWF